MAEYIPGETEDDVIKLTGQDIDLTQLTVKFNYIKSGLQNLEDHKTVADQETLDYYNQGVDDRNTDEKARLDNQAVDLYNEAKAIKDAGLLPLKYHDEFERLENYVLSL